MRCYRRVSPRLRSRRHPALAVSSSVCLSELHFWVTGKTEMLRVDTPGQRQAFGMDVSLGGACRTSRWLLHKCPPALPQPRFATCPLAMTRPLLPDEPQRQEWPGSLGKRSACQWLLAFSLPFGGRRGTLGCMSFAGRGDGDMLRLQGEAQEDPISVGPWVRSKAASQ